jgi:hypothetical protein
MSARTMTAAAVPKIAPKSIAMPFFQLISC